MHLEKVHIPIRHIYYTTQLRRFLKMFLRPALYPLLFVLACTVPVGKIETCKIIHTKLGIILYGSFGEIMGFNLRSNSYRTVLVQKE